MLVSALTNLLAICEFGADRLLIFLEDEGNLYLLLAMVLTAEMWTRSNVTMINPGMSAVCVH